MSNKKNINIRAKEVCKDEKGVVLVIAVALLAVLGLVGGIAVNTTTVDVSISSNYKSSKQAFFAAESGTEEARGRLRGTGTTANFIGDLTNPANGSWSVYISTDPSWNPADADTGDPDYDNVMYNYSTQQVSLQSDISYWVNIRHKRKSDAVTGTFINDGSLADNVIYYGYLDPANPTTPVQFSTSSANIYHPVEIVTASGNNSKGLKNIEIEVVRVPGPPILASIYSENDVDVNGTGIGTNVNGNDACGQGPAVDTIYVVGPPGTTTSSGNATYSPTGPVSGSDDIDIEFYVEELRSGAKTITNKNANDVADWGSPTNFVSLYAYSHDFPNGELRISDGVTGYGLLLVDGDLEIVGSFDWTGLIIVTGTIDFSGGGTVAKNINGAVLANNTVTLNGGVNSVYDSCAVDNALNSQGLAVLQWKQIY